ncbi:MAG TPA: di-heme oxidoredictase family protein [Polyangiaceae bacterium]|nr:di-heme oxidoredictase family protein [Polyangiaceae bacterium]
MTPSSRSLVALVALAVAAQTTACGSSDPLAPNPPSGAAPSSNGNTQGSATTNPTSNSGGSSNLLQTTGGSSAGPTGATAGEANAGTGGSPGGSENATTSMQPSGSGGDTGAAATGNGGTGGSPFAGGPSLVDGIVPLFNADTVLEPEVHFDRGDAIVTKWGDRGRDRHAREDEFQSYDHYLPHYWEHRTARYILTDYVSKGGSTIDVSWVTEWVLDKLPEFRAWYNGRGSVAQYTGNYAPLFHREGPGTYDNDHNKISDQGTQYKYTYTITNAIMLNGDQVPLASGQFMEIEASQFLDAPPVGRDNYYGTVFLYEVGNGGMVPWYTVGTWEDQSSERENSHKLDEKGWLGGRTTLPYQYSDEPDNNFMQMATNLSGLNAQPFVRGRRVHHTNMIDGSHDESAENETFTDLVNLSGPNFVNSSCDGCHHRNGRAPVADVGVPLDKWVFKVAAADGGKDPLIGSVLQPQGRDGSPGEGAVSIAQWVENAEGLRSPQYAFSGAQPALFSARIAPQLVGLGLLEAVDESTIIALEDVDDSDGDGISGKVQISADPVTGEKRVGRFGWKAGQSSLRHQIAGALNTDMGVMTSVLPTPDCGSMEQNCGNDKGPELSDEHFNDLVKYISLLGVRARRNLDDADALHGETLFDDLNCSGCHVTEMMTGSHHPLAELRDQLIHPYTDLLLHDMGQGLADNLGEREASGAEWRTTPLWGLGLSACVTGGVEGPFQNRTCTPHHDYLHDGRARSIEEAILWHGGEGQMSKDGYVALSAGDKAALLKFLESL